MASSQSQPLNLFAAISLHAPSPSPPPSPSYSYSSSSSPTTNQPQMNSNRITNNKDLSSTFTFNHTYTDDDNDNDSERPQSPGAFPNAKFKLSDGFLHSAKLQHKPPPADNTTPLPNNANVNANVNVNVKNIATFKSLHLASPSLPSSTTTKSYKPPPQSFPSSSQDLVTGMWRYTGTNLIANNSPKPASKSEVVKLESGFVKVMECVLIDARDSVNIDASLSTDSTISDVGIGKKFNQDYLNVFADVSSSSSYPSIQHHNGYIKDITNAVYTQKHADLTLSSLISQISSTSYLLGRCLGVVRGFYAGCFMGLKQLVSELLNVVNGLEGRIEGLEGTVRVLEGDRKTFEDECKTEMVAAFRQADEAIKEKEGEFERKERRHKVEKEKQNVNVKTLQSIIQSMKGNKTEVNAAEMFSKLAQLQSENDELSSKVNEMNAVKNKLRTSDLNLKLLQVQTTKSLASNKKLTVDLGKRSVLLKSLIEARDSKLTSEEYALLGGVEDGVNEDDGDEGGDEDYDSAVASTSQAHTQYRSKKSRGSNGDTVLCIRCKNHLDEVVQVAQYTNSNSNSNGKKTVGGGFKSLLPKLKVTKGDYLVADDISGENESGEAVKSTQSPSTLKIHKLISDPALPPLIKVKAMDKMWIVRCIRSIILSMTQSANDENSTTRFPEFVHAFFEEISHNDSTIKPNQSHLNLLSTSDTLRWSFYYGLKLLASQSPSLPEALLFWNMLNETYDCDYTDFYLFVFSLCRSISADITSQMGCGVIGVDNIHELMNRIESIDFVEEAGQGPKPRTIWILASDALMICDAVISNSHSDTITKDREVLTRAVNSISITSVSRLPDSDGDGDGDGKCMVVDLHLVIMFIMHTYRSELVNRRSQIALMFETTLTLSSNSNSNSNSDSSSNSSSSSNSYEKKGVDLQQFKALLGSIVPGLHISEVTQLYRDICINANNNIGVVNYESFMITANSTRLFSKSLSLQNRSTASCLNASCNDGITSVKVRYDIGAFVHLISQLLREELTLIENKLASTSTSTSTSLRLEFSNSRSNVGDMLGLSWTISKGRRVGGIDGLPSFFALRRLLVVCLKIKNGEDERCIGIGIGVGVDSGLKSRNNDYCDASEVDKVKHEIRSLIQIAGFKIGSELESIGRCKRSCAVGKIVNFLRKRTTETRK